MSARKHNNNSRGDSNNGNETSLNSNHHDVSKLVFKAKSGSGDLKDSRTQKEIDPQELEWEIPIAAIRLVACLTWTGSVLYATYHVFLACEVHLHTWYSDPVMNPGPLSGLFGRGKDATDYEWEMFSVMYATRLWLWYCIYIIMSRTIQIAYPEHWRQVSIFMSLIMFWESLGFLPAIFILLQPVIYWTIAQTRSKVVMWVATLLFIYNLNAPFVKIFVPDSSFSEYFFVITAAWNYARCVSFCCDIWEKENSAIGISYLLDGIWYCFYFPLSISGPLVTYESFEKNIIQRDFLTLMQRDLMSDFVNLLKNLIRVGCIAFLTELVLHFVYFRALSMTTTVHGKLSLWAICGIIYWLGQFFSMKYKVLYGIPTYIAEFDGMEMPPLPKCPAYLHRYSVLWRDFDRGLYNFLVKYIYLPTLNFIKKTDPNNFLPVDIQKLTASFMTFGYVYIWHSVSFDVFIWAALNFLGITIERLGSVLKRKIDKRLAIDATSWDFIIEPIVTVPLAGMSILNSSIFCGSMDAAMSFTKELWMRRHENWVLLFLYCFTHTAITLRTIQKQKVA